MSIGTNIVFTGRGYRNGQFVTRDIWERDARQHAFIVQDKVDHWTKYLVASRSDTSKARAAKENGTTVISYEQFDQLLRGIAPQVGGRIPGSMQQPKVDPSILAAALDRAAETIEGWGSF
jgi:hypothetical protein